MKYNTAISALMIMVNEYDKMESISRDDYLVLLKLLNPTAPHVTEELNEIYKLGDVICNSSWPEYDESKLVDDSFEMVVQVNGKVRGKQMVATGTSEEDMEKIAVEIDNVKKFIDGKEIVKIITIQNKIVNIVVKD